jgi:hypothetical protein
MSFNDLAKKEAASKKDVSQTSPKTQADTKETPEATVPADPSKT